MNIFLNQNVLDLGLDDKGNVVIGNTAAHKVVDVNS